MQTEAPPTTTRERILDAAMELFAQDGFSGTTITEIERRVGLAAGTGSLYRHFPSKEDLLRAAVEREVTRCRAAMEAARAELRRIDDRDARRAQVYELILRDVQRFERLYRLMLNEGDRVPELREAIWAALQRPAKNPPDRDSAVDAIAMAALGGYFIFSKMQGRPFNNVDEELFIETLVSLTRREAELTGWGNGSHAGD